MLQQNIQWSGLSSEYGFDVCYKALLYNTLIFREYSGRLPKAVEEGFEELIDVVVEW